MHCDSYEDILKLIDSLPNDEVWSLFGRVKSELKERGLIRTNNIIGERGEFLVEEIYKNNPNLPNIQKAPEGTQNVDAISRRGERYSIKTISLPGKTTSVFYGIEHGDEYPDKKFEYVVIVLLDKELNPQNVYQLDWEAFLKHKKWHSRMKAYNLSVTKALIADSTIIL